MTTTRPRRCSNVPGEAGLSSLVDLRGGADRVEHRSVSQSIAIVGNVSVHAWVTGAR
jgi:hypothetical protein